MGCWAQRLSNFAGWCFRVYALVCGSTEGRQSDSLSVGRFIQACCVAPFDHPLHIAWVPLQCLEMQSGVPVEEVAPPPCVRAMSQVSELPRQSLRFHDGLDCFRQTLRQEGARALFKGWLPSWLRLGPHFMISWPLMEFIRKYVFGLDYF